MSIRRCLALNRLHQYYSSGHRGDPGYRRNMIEVSARGQGRAAPQRYRITWYYMMTM